MQGSPVRTGSGFRRRLFGPTSLVPTGVAFILGVTAVSLYSIWRVDRVQENVEVSNQFYVPVLKQLNLLNGKWSAYQRSFEQSVGFRKWGTNNATHDSQALKFHLRKMLDPNLM